MAGRWAFLRRGWTKLTCSASWSRGERLLRYALLRSGAGDHASSRIASPRCSEITTPRTMPRPTASRQGRAPLWGDSRSSCPCAMSLPFAGCPGRTADASASSAAMARARQARFLFPLHLEIAGRKPLQVDVAGQADHRPEQQLRAADDEPPSPERNPCGRPEHDASDQEPAAEAEIVEDAQDLVPATDDHFVAPDGERQRVVPVGRG